MSSYWSHCSGIHLLSFIIFLMHRLPPASPVLIHLGNGEPIFKDCTFLEREGDILVTSITFSSCASWTLDYIISGASALSVVYPILSPFRLPSLSLTQSYLPVQWKIGKRLLYSWRCLLSSLIIFRGQSSRKPQDFGFILFQFKCWIF